MAKYILHWTEKGTPKMNEYPADESFRGYFFSMLLRGDIDTIKCFIVQKGRTVQHNFVKVYEHYLEHKVLKSKDSVEARMFADNWNIIQANKHKFIYDRV